MNALNRSFDDIGTPPLPWAMPIPMDYGSPVGDDAEAMKGWTESVNVTATVAAAHEWLAEAMLSETKASASIQAMHKVATARAWIEKLLPSENSQVVTSAFVNRAFMPPRYIDVSGGITVGSYGLVTGVASRLDIDIVGALGVGTFLLSDTSALAGYDRYSVPNWDGDQAEAILPETIAAARSLLQVLPSNFGPPDIAPAADGTIGLEWVPETGSLRKLFIDVGPRTVWRAYWKFANGNYDEAHGLTSEPDISDTMQKLFSELSK